ncbi:MAG: DUF262 domain-containing protein [Candidatus Desantisbacteria bacterium]
MFKIRLLEAKTLSWWHSERDNIDFNPLYQRKGALWSPKEKAYLIDSILNDFDVPKIYLADFTYSNSSLNKLNKSYAIIDGKQRYESLFDFFDGKLVLDSEFKFNADPSIKLGGLSYRDLKSQYPKIAAKFENYNLAVMGVQTDEENLINQLFVRLNQGKPLTGAEIRSAMGGVIPSLISKIIEHNFFKENVKFSKARKQEHNVAAKLLLVEFRGSFVDMKKRHLDNFVYEGMLVQNTNFNGAVEKVVSILDDMSNSFVQSDNLLKSPGIIVIYYWLFRNHSNNKDIIRKFLVSFNEERDRNKKLQNYSESEDLVSFDICIRSLNDQGSVTKAYNILENRFNKYI